MYIESISNHYIILYVYIYVYIYIYTYSNVMQLYGHIVFLKLEIVLYSLTQSYI